MHELTADKDANIGIAVIIDGKDTVAINGDKPFPMLSVYKLPIAMALGDHLQARESLIPDSVTIYKSDLKPDTYSPMRDRYDNIDSIKLPLQEVMAYSLQQSDNNASDILLALTGGVNNVSRYLNRIDGKGINIISTEDEMHADPALCYQNTATPVAMASLIDRFDNESHDPFSQKIKRLLETCETGTGRLPKPLLNTGAIIGHKTGTGFTLPDGRLMAVNDAGYVHLPVGSRYTIVVFIENSGYGMDETEALIATISETVFKTLR